MILGYMISILEILFNPVKRPVFFFHSCISQNSVSVQVANDNHNFNNIEFTCSLLRAHTYSL